MLRMFKLKINHDNHPFYSILTEGGILKTTITHNHRILPVIYIVFHFPVCTSFFSFLLQFYFPLFNGCKICQWKYS